jgi:hypothetical protein
MLFLLASNSAFADWEGKLLSNAEIFGLVLITGSLFVGSPFQIIFLITTFLKKTKIHYAWARTIGFLNFLSAGISLFLFYHEIALAIALGSLVLLYFTELLGKRILNKPIENE